MAARPKSIFKPSPNFSPRDPGREISCVILHATATKSIDSPLAWLCNKESGVSAHYLIDVTGQIYQLVDEQNVAWHAGVSEWHGAKNVNNFSVGIELVNANDGKMEYPKKLLDACADLVSSICVQYNIDSTDVIGHADIAPVRKNDPLCFPWGVFREMLKARGIQPV